MDKKKSCRWLCGGLGLIAGMMIFFSAAVHAAAQTPGQVPERRVLRVAFPELEGISEVDEYGSYTGLLGDYLNEIAKYTGWEYEYIQVENEDLVPGFEEGRFDLMGGAFYSAGFEEFFAYPDYNTGRSRAVLLCRRDDDSLKGYDLTSLNGKTIGVYEKAVDKIRYLNEFLSSNDLDCQLIYYTYEEMENTGNLYRQLRDKKVDMLLGNDLEIGGEFRMVTSFQAQPYYIVTTVDKTDILDGLNMALEYILESTPDFAEEVYNANFPDVRLMDIQLSERELAYINEKQTITVALPKDWHPLYCDNAADHHEGLIPELLSEISMFTGLQFTYVYSDSYAESIRLVQQGKADILGAYLNGDEEAFADGLALSQPYIELNNIVMKNKSVSYPGEGLTCAVLTGRTLPPNLNPAEIRYYDTLAEMITAVNTWEADYLYGVSAMLEQEMQNHRYLNILPVTQASDDNTQAAFAIAMPAEAELLTVLNKAISNIPTHEKTAMLNRNMVSLGYTRMSIQDLIYANPLVTLLLFSGILLSATTGALFFIRSRMKNSIMRSRLEAAEEKSHAKSEFLSRMSHEIRTPMNAIIGLTDLACMEQNVPPEIGKKLHKIRSSSQYLLSLINDILDMSRIENQKMVIERQGFSLSEVLDALQGMMGVQAEQKGLTFMVDIRTAHDFLEGDPVRLRQVLTNLLSNAIKFTPAGGTVTLQADEINDDGQTAEYYFCVKDTGVGIPPEDQERIFDAFEQLTPSVSRSAGTGLGLPICRSLVELMGGELQVMSEPGKGSAFCMTLRFPLDTGEKERSEASEIPDVSLDGVRILLAEDNDLNAEIAQELLATQGIHTERACDGQQAVDLFTACAPGTYQAVLMDILMPVKNGYEATREIRASGRPDADIPVIAMTANSFKQDEEEARSAGMDGFVPKPVDPERLFSVLREFVKAGRPHAAK